MAQRQSPQAQPVVTMAGKSKDPLVNALAYCVAPQNEKHQTDLVPIIEELLNIRNGSKVTLNGVIDQRHEVGPNVIQRFQNKINNVLGRKEGAAELCLVYGGATKIKSYVFESSEISEIRGASAILDWLNTDTPIGFVKKHTLPKECILYSSGGNIVAFAPTNLGNAFATHIEQMYTEHTITGQSVAVSVEIRLIELAFGRYPEKWALGELRKQLDSNHTIHALLSQSFGRDPKDISFAAMRDQFNIIKGFGELITVATSAQLARRDSENMGSDQYMRPFAHEELTPWVEKCYTSDVRPASVIDKDEQISLSTERKRMVGRAVKYEINQTKTSDNWQIPSIRRWDEEYNAFLQTNNLRRNELPTNATITPARSFEEVADACAGKSKSIGVIYVDGNNLGQRYATMSSLRAYRDFSKQLTEQTKSYVFRALHKYITCFNKEQKYIQPFEIIAIGGDDCFIVVPGDVALQIAYEIGAAFNDFEPRKSPSTHQQVRHRFGISQTQQPSLSVSAGVVIADHKTPFFLLERLVNDLLKSAKKASRLYQTGTIDFISLTSLGAVSDSIDTIRDAYTYADHTQLTARPYTWEELNFIINRVKSIKKELAGQNFNSHLYRIANVMHTQGRLASDLELQSTVTNYKKNNQKLEGIALAASYLTPTPSTTAQALDTLSLWHNHHGKYETILVDLLETLDLIRP